MTPDQLMTKARANLVMAHPFFGTLALRLKMKADPEMKEKASCDGATLTYNPEKVAELSLSKAQGLIAHCVMHPALLHHTRRNNRDVKKWNKACDYSINSLLESAGIDLPEGTFNGTAYAGKTAEEIYTLLPDGDDDDQGSNDPGGDGGVTDSPDSQAQGSSESQQQHEEAQWKIALAQAAHVAKQAGKLPGDMERLIEDTLAPVFPWRSILRRFMTEKAADDFSWKRGNRRFIAQGLYLPTRESEGTGEIVVAIDTSGSIGQEQLDEFASEVVGIIEEVRPSRTYVIYCDSDIAHVDEFGPHDELEFKLHGGGGTDFRPPFKWVEEKFIMPKCFVYLTDGYGPFPEEPDYPVMWCINNNDVVPPHGEHLILE